MDTTSISSASDVEKSALEKDLGQPHLDDREEDILEASQPPFTAYGHGDETKDEADEDGTIGADGAVLTNIESKRSVNNIKSIPNGGTMAWMQVLGVFFVFFNTWGTVNAFGIYQTYYETGLLSTSSPSDISWIGSMEAFALMIVGSIAGPIYDKGYAHELLLGGSILIVLGQLTLGLSKEYYQVFLAQAVSIGIGTGLIFVSGLAILSTYFSTKLASATGIAAAGSSLGGMLYPIIFQKLQPRIGFGWTTRVLGFIMLGTLVVSNVVLRVRVVPSARRKFLDFPAWKELPYLFFNIGLLLSFFGMYAPFFYIQSYCLEEKIMSPDLAFYTLAVLNAASTFGRVIPNYIADFIGPLNVILPCAFVCGILQFALVGSHSTASVMVVITLYGFFSGTLVSLPGTIYVHLAGPTNRGLIGTRMGMGFAFVSVGILLGTPITGAILAASGFKYIWIYGGSVLVAGSSFVALARLIQGKWKLWVKV